MWDSIKGSLAQYMFGRHHGPCQHQTPKLEEIICYVILFNTNILSISISSGHLTSLVIRLSFWCVTSKTNSAIVIPMHFNYPQKANDCLINDTNENICHEEPCDLWNHILSYNTMSHCSVSFRENTIAVLGQMTICTQTDWCTMIQSWLFRHSVLCRYTYNSGRESLGGYAIGSQSYVTRKLTRAW